jgi:hypothetical protein
MHTVFEAVPTTLVGLRAKIDFATSVDHVAGSILNTDTAEPLKRFFGNALRMRSAA